jgi:hypothetical protein
MFSNSESLPIYHDRGRINTLAENTEKIQQVATEVGQAIAQARQEDEHIKAALERKDPGYTADMARGRRYLVDLLASNTIQRIQADGFNGPRGDGFPLASMLAMVSLENKEIGPILAAHVYTVCPTAIPTLPSPKKDATEDELMESLGMQKDKNGEYESFDKFLTRTEVSVRLGILFVADHIIRTHLTSFVHWVITLEYCDIRVQHHGVVAIFSCSIWWSHRSCQVA